MLGADLPGAPEPVGVPAPQVVARGQEVARAFAQRPVGCARSDSRSSPARRRRSALPSTRSSGANATPSKIDVGPARQLEPCRQGGLRARLMAMLDGDEAAHRQRARGDGEGVAERAVGVGEAVERARCSLSRAVDDVAVAGQGVERDDHARARAVAERRRLDAHAGSAPPAIDRKSGGATHGMVPRRSVASTSVA